MSKESPKWCKLIALHSICHPGLPLPHGESHAGSPGLADFQRAKSLCSLLSDLSNLPDPPAWTASIEFPVSVPNFSGAEETENQTPSDDT